MSDDQHSNLGQVQQRSLVGRPSAALRGHILRPWYMETGIKECRLNLYDDRTSASTMRANPLRLWFAAMAYVLLSALRRIALAGTRLAKATCGSIRLKLLKIGARVSVSARRIKIAFASACPAAEVFALAHARLCGTIA